MTIYSPLTHALINPAAPAAVQLFTRQSVTPLSQTAFCAARGTVLRSNCKVCSYSSLATWLKPALPNEKASTYFPQKPLEIPNNLT